MKKLTVVGAIASLCFATSAFAITAKNSVLIGTDLGWGQLTTPKNYLYSYNDLQATGADSVRTSYSVGHFVYAVHAGYDFALYKGFLLGPEVGYADNGQSRYRGYAQDVFSDQTRITSYEYNLLAHAEYLFVNGFNVFGKAGFAQVHQNTEAVQGLGSTVASPSRHIVAVRPELVVGMGYEFTNGIGFGVSYKRLFGDNDNRFAIDSDRGSNPYALNAIYANLSYRFSV